MNLSHAPLTDPYVRVIAYGSSMIIPAGGDVHCKYSQEKQDLSLYKTIYLEGLRVRVHTLNFSMQTSEALEVPLSTFFCATPCVVSYYPPTS